MWKYLRWSTWQRLTIKVVRNKGTPESLAMGLAIGVFAGFIIPTGGQILVALAIAYFFKANKILAAMGTMVNNPYTAPFLVPAQCWLGSLLLCDPLDFSEISRQIGAFLAGPSWVAFRQLGAGLLFPLLLGGAAFAVAFSLPAYYLTLAFVKYYRARKTRKRNIRPISLPQES